MGPKLDNLDANMSADEIAEHIDLTPVKGAFLTVVGREAFTLLKTLRGAAKEWHISQNFIYCFR